MNEELNRCESCEGFCKKPYTTCWTCKQKTQAKQNESKDQWREGVIEGHIDKLTLDFCLKFADKPNDVWESWTDVRKRFSELIKGR